MLWTILIVVLILAVIGALPTWGHSRSWGYLPSGGLGLVLVILLVLFLMGRLQGQGPFPSGLRAPNLPDTSVFGGMAWR